MPMKQCDECGLVETILAPVEMQREGGEGFERRGPTQTYEVCPNEPPHERGTHNLSDLPQDRR
jgi:hypothetical protein